MKTNVKRETVNLTGYPDLVVIYLGMRVRTFAGIKTLLGLGPQIDKAGAAKPDGLLHFENNILFSLFPMHVGMRWYWRDFESMERWTRAEPHRKWWQDFMKNSGGTSFWHETYFMRGGIEALYADSDKPIGLQTFAPVIPVRTPMFSARSRVGMGGDVPPQPEGTKEDEIY